MHALFRLNQSPIEDERAELATRIGLRERQVATWFQNKRARTKQKFMLADVDQLRQENAAMMRELEQYHSLKDQMLGQVGDLKSANAMLEAEIQSLRVMMHTNPASPTMTVSFHPNKQKACTSTYNLPAADSSSLHQTSVAIRLKLR